MNANEQPKAVVLGGTGHIGAAVARRFAMGGFEVFATGRRDKPRPNLTGTGIRVRAGDDTDREVLQNWTRGAAVVVDCATPYPVWMFEGSAQALVRAAVARTRAVIDAVEREKATLVLISSFTTLSRARGLLGGIRQGVREGSHPYFVLKETVQDHVQAYLDGGGRGAIIAPSTCFGPYDLKEREQTFIPMLLSEEIRVLTEHELNLVDVRDVADVVFSAAASDIREPVPVFGHNIALRALVRLVCGLRAVPEPRLSVPSGLGTAGLYAIETAYALAGRKTPWPSLPMLLLDASYAAAPSPLQRRLHPTLRPLEETLEDAIAWYERIGSIRRQA